MKPGLNLATFHDWELRPRNNIEVFYCKFCNHSYMSAEYYCPKNSHIELVQIPVVRIGTAAKVSKSIEEAPTKGKQEGEQ